MDTWLSGYSTKTVFLWVASDNEILSLISAVFDTINRIFLLGHL